MGSIMDCAAETARPLIDQRRHELTISLPPDPIWVYGDASRLEQVVTNLLTNAAKYTQEGGRIWLSVNQEGGKAVLRVRDTGLGIAPNFPAPRLRPLHPSGAFLRPFARRLRHWIDSGETAGRNARRGPSELPAHWGKAASSSMSLDCLSAGQDSTQNAAAPTPKCAERKTAKRALRVLVVDDNAAAARVLEMLIKASGHQVRMAHTGSTALAAALDYRPDVILLDIGLPEIDGLEVAQADSSATPTPGHRAGGHNGVRAGVRPAAFAASGVRSPPGQARRLRESAANLGGSRRKRLPDAHESGRMDMRFAAGLNSCDLAKERKSCQGCQG